MDNWIGFYVFGASVIFFLVVGNSADQIRDVCIRALDVAEAIWGPRQDPYVPMSLESSERDGECRGR